MSGQTHTQQEPGFSASFFGVFGLRRGDVAITQNDLHSKQMTKLLAALIYRHERPYTAAQLYDLLWPGTSGNPEHALANLVYRLRKALAAAWPHEELILSREGGARWNPAVPLQTDFQLFDRLALEAATPERERMGALEGIAACYKGRFLADFSDDLEVFSIQSHYHSAYLHAVNELAQHYDAARDYGRMETLCQDALLVDQLDEDLHCGLLRAYIATGRTSAAERHYREAARIVSEATGGAGGQRMRRMHDDMLRRVRARETDLGRVMADMDERRRDRSAFHCDYEVFQKLFVLRLRLRERQPAPTSLVLLSLYVDGEEDAPGTRTSAAMEGMLATLLTSLRQGDAVCRYSASQYLVMLSNCDANQAHSAADRVRANFDAAGHPGGVQVQYSVRELA